MGGGAVAKSAADHRTELVKAAMQGDEKAMGQLVDATQNDLYRFLYFLCGSGPLAQDLCQEAYVKAFQNIRDLDDPVKFMGWIKAMARNLFIDFTRKKSNQNEEDFAEENVEVMDTAEGSETEQVMIVRETLTQLETESREVLILVDMEGHSYIEAAEILGITESAVRSRLHRARQQFSDIFKK